MKNIHARQVTQKYSYKGLKNSYRGNFMRLENSHPHPHNFSNDPILKL